jgi:hypothetical protein
MEVTKRTDSRGGAIAMTGCAALLAVATPTFAVGNVQLTDGASKALLDPATQAGVYDWVVGGQDQLQKQWWWLQTGGQRFSLDALGAPVVSQPDVNRAILTYGGPGGAYSVQISYELKGTGLASGQALLKESVVIANTSGAPLNLSLFLYSDFNLGGAPDDSVSLFGMNDATPPFSSTVGWFEAQQSDALVSHGAIFNFRPLVGEIGLGSSILDKLNNTTSPLASNAGAVLAPTVGATGLSEFGPVGPGDVAYALQWNFTIATNNAAIVGVDKRVAVIPEPAVATLGLLGLAGLLIRR